MTENLEFNSDDPLVAFIDSEGVVYIEGVPYMPKKVGYGYNVYFGEDFVPDPDNPNKALTFASYELMYAIQLVAYRAIQNLPGISSDYVESLVLLLDHNYRTMFPEAKGYDL